MELWVMSMMWRSRLFISEDDLLARSEGVLEVVETEGRYLQDAVYLGDVFHEVRVAALDEVEVAEPGAVVQELVVVPFAVVAELHRVEAELVRHEAQLGGKAEGGPVDVGGDEDAKEI